MLIVCMIYLSIRELYLHLYLLYVQHISYPLVTFWSSAFSWCIRAGWGRLIDVSFWGRLDTYSHFYDFTFGVLVTVFWLGCRRYIFFIDFCLRNHWVHYEMYLRFWRLWFYVVITLRLFMSMMVYDCFR